MDAGIVTQVLKGFTDTFTGGATTLIPTALAILYLLMVIELALIGIWWMYSQETDVLGLFWKMCAFAVLSALITQWPTLSRTLIAAFVEMGLRAGGGGISEADYTDPGNIALYGIQVTAVVFAHLNTYAGLDALKNLPEILISIPISLLIMCTYFWMAIWIFLATLEYYAVTAIGVALLPFALNAKVAFIAEKVLAYVAAAAVHQFALAFVTAAILPVLYRLSGGMNPTFKSLAVQLFGAFALVCLAWRASKLGDALTGGRPQFTTQDVQQVIRNSMQTVTVAGQAARAAAPRPNTPATPVSRRRP